MKDQIVIEENGWRFVMEPRGKKTCGDCAVTANCMGDHILVRYCEERKGRTRYICTSATKITPEPKMYFAWNREDARHLVGKEVYRHDGSVHSEWSRSRLEDIGEKDMPFLVCDLMPVVMIREIPTIKLTRSELNEKYGVPDNVVIVEGE